MKIVNINSNNKKITADLSKFPNFDSDASITIFSGDKNSKNEFKNKQNIYPHSNNIKLKKKTEIEVLPYSLTIIRIKQK